MNKLLLITCLLAFPVCLFASTTTREMTLDIQFDSQPNPPFYDESLHFENRVKINLEQTTDAIVMTQSKMVNPLPYTLALSLKSAELINTEASLQFNLVSYGFDERG
jgi:hypothetical protein